MTEIVNIKNLHKKYGSSNVLNNINLNIHSGEIVGVVGTNGAGKSTLLKSILGLTKAKGEIKVCGLNPFIKQKELMKVVSFVADTAILPKWLTAKQLLDYMHAMHPNFSINKAKEFLESTNIKMDTKVKKLSKGMMTQLHLALIVAIKSTLLVLDEPTLGLDIIKRKEFYNQLLEHYFDDNNTIVITTHQIEEIEHILTRAIFIENGEILADFNINELENRFAQIIVSPDKDSTALKLKPIYKENTISGNRYIFDSVNIDELNEIGDVKVPSLTDLFVALAKKSKELNCA